MSTVASGRDEEDSGITAAVNRVEQCLREAAATPGVVGGDDRQAVTSFEIGEIVHRLYRVRSGAAAPSEELRGNHRHVPVHPGDAHSVASNRPDGAGNMSAVVVLIAVERRVVVAVEVPPAHVVDVAIAVVVHAVNGIERVDEYVPPRS